MTGKSETNGKRASLTKFFKINFYEQQFLAIVIYTFFKNKILFENSILEAILGGVYFFT